MFIGLKPLAERKFAADQVIARLRWPLGQVPGAAVFLQAVQDLRVGGRASNAQCQYTLQGDDFRELALWVPRVMARLRTVPHVADVSTDQQDRGRQSTVTIDRATAARLGLTRPRSWTRPSTTT